MKSIYIYIKLKYPSAIIEVDKEGRSFLKESKTLR